MILSKTQRRQFLELCLKKAQYNPFDGKERLQELSQYVLPKLNLITPHAVCGAWAANNYASPRATQDVDLLVRENDLDNIVFELQEQGYSVDGPLELCAKDQVGPMFGFRLIKLQSDFPIVDILTSEDSWVEEAIASADKDPSDNPVVSIPYLVLMKMDARAQDMADIIRILGKAKGEVLAKTKDLIIKYLPNSIDNFASLHLMASIESGK